AAEAWEFWKTTPNGQQANLPFAAITHPTQPESSSKGDKTKLAAATKRMLENWNAALQVLSPLQHTDVPTVPVPYGDTWAGGDRLPGGAARLDARGRRLGQTRRRRRSRQAPQHNPDGAAGYHPMTGRGRRWFPLARVEPAPRRGAMLTASPKKPTLIDPLSG